MLSLTDFIGWRFGWVAKTYVVLFCLFNMSIGEGRGLRAGPLSARPRDAPRARGRHSAPLAAVREGARGGPAARLLRCRASPC